MNYKTLIIFAFSFCLIALAADVQPHQPTARVCGNPNVECQTDLHFSPHDLAFRLSNAAWNHTYSSAPFYAVILASRKAIDQEDPDEDCRGIFTEKERLQAQKAFPNHKVFTSRNRCYGLIGYTNINVDYNFLAVYGGETMAEAKKILAQAKKHAQWKTANIRQMQVKYFHGCPL